MKSRLILATMLVLAGCGVSGGKKLNALTADDMVKLCAEEEEASFTCEFEGGSFTYTFGTDCEIGETDPAFVNPFTAACTATVADSRACNDALRAALALDPCAPSTELPECSFMADCYDMGT